MIKRIKNILHLRINPKIRKNIIIPRLHKRFNNPEVSIFANNCVGGVICHDLGIRFNSPFINLWLYPKDFIKFCSNPRHYAKCQLHFLSDSQKDFSYPIASLDDITIYFMHYNSDEDAEKSWNERVSRINYNDIRCILVERDGCTYKDIIEFSKLPYPTVALTYKPYKNIKCTNYIRGFESHGEVGDIIPLKTNLFSGKRYLDDFDFVTFLNKQQL